MKKLGFAIAGIVALASAPAFAADLRMPVKAPMAAVAPGYNWTGFYIGINGGYGFGESRHDFSDIGTSTGTFNVDGGLLGGTLGANFQTGQVVWGFEGDLAWANIRGSAACPNPAFTCSTALDWLGTLRGRLGFGFSNVLAYITGGLAAGDVQATVAGGPPFFAGQSETRLGWTAGGGLEVAFGPNWSIKAEYLYVDLGSAACAIPNCSALSVDNVNFVSHIARAGINYRF